MYSLCKEVKSQLKKSSPMSITAKVVYVFVSIIWSVLPLISFLVRVFTYSIQIQFQCVFCQQYFAFQ